MASQSDAIEKFFRILNGCKEPAYDVETTGLDWKRNKCIGYSVSDGTTAEYIPVRHSGGGNINNIDAFEHALARDISSHQGRLVGHNIKFDAHFSLNHGISLGDKVIDTMVNEALLDENRRSYSLENVAKSYEGVTPKLGKKLYEHIAEKTGCNADRNSMGNFHLLPGDDPLVVEYAAGDTLTTKQLYESQKRELYVQELDRVHWLENKLNYVLTKMERRGVQVDLEEIEKVKTEVDDKYIQARAKIPHRTNEFGDILEMNYRSSKDLKEYFEQCEIDDWPMTEPTQRFPDGQPSFRKDYLQSTPEGLLILNIRKYAHLQNSFLDRLDDHVYKSKIHTTFNQTRGETHGTRSGRLSSAYPNLQQVPKRDKELGKIYRRIFVPREHFVFVEYDYSQAEPRLYSHYSGEPALVNGYNATPFIDMHTIASELMGVSRDVAKNLNLGIMYTMGATKLSIQLGISYEAALQILKEWYSHFPRVRGFTKRASQVAEERGYVYTIFGRRSRFDNPKFSYRAANRIIQGGSADILKYKMCQIDDYLVTNNLEEECRMLLNIHDAIVFEIHEKRLDLIPVLKDIMEKVQVPPFSLKVPFIAEYKSGKNWSEASYGS